MKLFNESWTTIVGGGCDSPPETTCGAVCCTSSIIIIFCPLLEVLISFGEYVVLDAIFGDSCEDGIKLWFIRGYPVCGQRN